MPQNNHSNGFSYRTTNKEAAITCVLLLHSDKNYMRYWPPVFRQIICEWRNNTSSDYDCLKIMYQYNLEIYHSIMSNNRHNVWNRYAKQFV